ncbi:hypothetical protein ABZY45_27640 [Streptomyces sp. NPDC006516]|uniref:hypothetical protein n=1 Tax=Streptomyces sp. NPDC006516 TaxID=3154309 RepID=UPI0033B58FF7
MTTAHHLRLIDGMRTRDFPLERLPSGSGVSGPGYHTAILHGEDSQEEGDEADRVEHRARCLAEHDALITLLTLRWGEPQVVSLWSAQERMMAGEAIAEPWSEAVASCEYLQLWRAEDRWIAVVLHTEDEGPGCELGVLVTVVDPP